MNVPRYILLGGFMLGLLPSCMTRAQAVRAWTDTISIPTYKLGPADPNPPFPLVSKNPVYPYTMLDDLGNDRVPVSYRAICLENQYLKITILPQLGGHTYVYDKIDHREVLYRPRVIKYGLVGPRGAWIAGGTEFNFPFDHTTATVSPVESKLVHSPDGSATAYVGLLDRVSHMYWQVAITLRPETARVQEDITLFNPTVSSRLYKYYTNSAVPATAAMQWIYPMRETIFDDPFAVVQSWPVWKGVDRSWYKNVPEAMAIFGRNVHRNYFGVYYHEANYGVVHVANYRQDPGKKVWTWGTAQSGTIWEKLLSDRSIPYSEIQSGRFQTQGASQFLNPGRVEQWTEYWYPVRGLDGGFVQATPQMAINVVRSPGDVQALTLALSPVAAVKSATVIVRDRSGSGAKVLKRIAGVDLVPLQTLTWSIPVADPVRAAKSISVDIQDSAGKTLLDWSAAEPIDGNPDLVPEVGKAIKKKVVIGPDTPIEQLYLHGLFQQKTGDWRGAEKTYAEVLKRDPGYIPALLKVAWRDYGAAEYGKAEALLQRALARDNDVHNEATIPYALGVVERAEGRLNRANDAFWQVIHYGNSSEPGPSPAQPLMELGEIAIQQHHYQLAADLLHRAIAHDPHDALAGADLAVADRLGGNPQEAQRVVVDAIKIMPLLPYALAERWQDAGAAAGEQDWTKVVESDPENFLAIAGWYQDLGAWASSERVLHAAIENLPTQQVSPMVYYDLAFDAAKAGHPDQAARWWKQAASLPVQKVFPNRLDEVAVLQAAIRHDPHDAHAQYALGNFLFAHGRYEDAARLWQGALANGFDDAVLLRNLAVYQWHVNHRLDQAADLYRRAIRLNPEDYRLYTHLDEIYAEQDRPAQREALFKSAPASVLDQDTVLARRMILLMEQSKPEAALALMIHHTFKPFEGGKAIHQMYVMANLEKGRAALAAGQSAQALQDFQQALRYPVNLGTGRPPLPDLSEQQYWIGNALKAKGDTAAATAAWQQAAAEGSVYSALADRKLGQEGAAERILKAKIEAAAAPDATVEDLVDAARAEQFQGNAAASTRYFERALAMDPLLWQARIEMKQMGRTSG